ncbi:MAG: 16S rRNA (cytidine(1402)-2'-O)-methyltransferase [Candidatus Omnitrophica bacterium]|nr:16S rRNA (cytidine(1402)-2'-O)-methyltransferase [Candidatus Omnitrophota bacterium]
MLYLVPTPIGNLRDITLRALDVLKEADLIACEDTRQTQKLLNHYEIKKPLISFHEHSGPGRVDEIIRELETGKKVALVSDGGMPLISDPGYPLVRKAIYQGIRIEALPGPTAGVTALAASGLPAHQYSFFGFLPIKAAAKTKTLDAVKEREDTLLFHESPYRVVKTLEIMLSVFGDREAVVSREISKKFEEISRGHLSELIEKFKKKEPKGEFVILVAGQGQKKVLSE